MIILLFLCSDVHFQDTAEADIMQQQQQQQTGTALASSNGAAGGEDVNRFVKRKRMDRMAQL
jgi:hypothetical protein